MQEDRRIARTRKALQKSLDELINQKQYTDINVYDVTENANIGYRTFYNHYKSIDDLFVSLILNHLGDINDQLKKDLNYSTQLENGKLFFSYIQKNINLFKSLFDCPLQEKVKEISVKNVLESSVYGRLLWGTDDPVIANLLVNHMVSSLYSLIKWWIKNKGKCHVSKVSEIYADLITGATLQYVNTRYGKDLIEISKNTG